MNALIGKTPFFRLLLPIIAGIIAGSLFPGILSASLPAALGGLLLMLLSFFIRPDEQFRFRWLFGAGVCFFLFSLSLYQYRQHAESTRLTPSGYGQYDLGIVLDIPEVKPRSIAVHIKTALPEEKKVILYLEQTDEARGLIPGDEIVFLSRVEPFSNFGNPDDFDYTGYMQVKGFAGSGYVPGSDWQKTGRQAKSIPVMAQRCRAKMLDFYHSFRLESDAYAFICALTLGYKVHLSNDLQEAFRASGTAHVLALSGLHVGIIYAVISLLFSFFGKSGYGFLARQWLIITALWAFVFIVGMSASVVRAAIMLTLFSIGDLYHRNGFTYNSLAAAAFFILIFRPFSLFDVGFQMSFGAVFGILFFNPKMSRLYRPPNKVVKYVWNLLCITTTAQLGVFPLVLYHFGTFPTYFFITNMLVVPLVGIIIYTTFPLILFGLLRSLQWDFITVLYTFFQWIEKILIGILLRIVYISESIPFAQISDKKISFLQLILLLLFMYPFVRFLSSHRARPLIISLVALLFFQFTITYKNLTPPAPQLTVFNSPGQSEIAVFHNNKRHYMEIPENNILPHPEKRIFLLSDAAFTTYHAGQQFPLDILILSQYGSFDIEQLLVLFRPAMIVLDSSLPPYAAGRIARECTALGIEVHDVTENGAFSLNF
ncbi:ComEC/Rec2 family competence protein [uncultured Proteiniphilum sp.]|uniref:ComEC/Rec2 family competence protein n=1 Tax=uncultured Proteiniphilum sp. TaxID=497637 RepID=UPI00262AC8BC|nr:ComEC/Rec2 family competence protein [uncultured Proteiniphilum sp.]